MRAYAGEEQQPASTSPFSESKFKNEEWKLALRIAATGPFQRSAFLTHFLLYICDRKLSNREDEITEHQIGVQALGRPETYHPGEDNIVRSYARTLRKRLEEYFLKDGKDEKLRIVIPLGQYIPVFEANIRPDTPEEAIHQEHSDPEPQPDIAAQSLAHEPPPSRFSLLSKIGIIVVAGLICLVSGFEYVHHSKEAAQSSNLYKMFWQSLFNSKQTAYIVTGDSGFALLQDMTGRQIRLADYVNGDLDKWFPTFGSTQHGTGGHFDADRLSGYTSVADLNGVAGLLFLPETRSAHIVVRNARSVHMNDLREVNLILLGGPHANPWGELFEPESAFRLDLSFGPDERSIVNKHPRSGEQAIYRYIANASPNLTYTIVSYLPSIDGNGHALLIEGVNVAGTEAGSNFLLNQNTLLPILKKAERKDGSLDCFEVLLETQTIGSSAPDARPIIERYGCPSGGTS